MFCWCRTLVEILSYFTRFFPPLTPLVRPRPTLPTRLSTVKILYNFLSLLSRLTPRYVSGRTRLSFIRVSGSSPFLESQKFVLFPRLCHCRLYHTPPSSPVPCRAVILHTSLPTTLVQFQRSSPRPWPHPCSVTIRLMTCKDCTHSCNGCYSCPEFTFLLPFGPLIYEVLRSFTLPSTTSRHTPLRSPISLDSSGRFQQIHKRSPSSTVPNRYRDP